MSTPYVLDNSGPPSLCFGGPTPGILTAMIRMGKFKHGRGWEALTQVQVHDQDMADGCCPRTGRQKAFLRSRQGNTDLTDLQGACQEMTPN